MKHIWQNIACKALAGTFALSLAFMTGCDESSNPSKPSGGEKVESSSSSVEEEDSSSSVDEDEVSSSSEESEDEASSSSKAKSSSSSKKRSSSSAAVSSSSKIPFNFSSSSRKAKSSSSRSASVVKTCTEVAHTGTSKTLTGSSVNKILGTKFEFHNEFDRNTGSATYYADGSFELSCEDDYDCAARMQVSNNSGKPYDELGEITVEFTASVSGEADFSAVGARAYASSNDGLQNLYVSVIEAVLDESEVLGKGKLIGSVDLDGSKYDVIKYEDQMVTSEGVKKEISFFLVRIDKRLCGIVNMSAVFDELEELGAPNIPLRWVAASADISFGVEAEIDMQEVKIKMGDVSASDVDDSDALDEFCKTENAHTGEKFDILESDEYKVTSTDGEAYVFEAYGSGDGLTAEYYEDLTFAMECAGEKGEHCETTMYKVFSSPVLFSDTGRINVEYSFAKEGGKGQSILGAHGFMEKYDATSRVEFYVLEDWLESFPMTEEFGKRLGTFSLDGSEYEVYQKCNDSKKGGVTVTSCYVTSIRKDKRSCGSVNVSGQMAQWEKLGVEMFPITKVGAMGFMTSGASGTVDFVHVNVDVAKK